MKLAYNEDDDSHYVRVKWLWERKVLVGAFHFASLFQAMKILSKRRLMKAAGFFRESD